MKLCDKTEEGNEPLKCKTNLSSRAARLARHAGRFFAYLICFVIAVRQLHQPFYVILSPAATSIYYHPCAADAATTTASRKERCNVVNERRAVVFVGNKRYGTAAAASAASVRKDGGYNGDIILIIDNDITKAEMTQMIIEQGGVVDEKLILLEASELLDSLLLEHDARETTLHYLREPPTSASCFEKNRVQGHRGYYLKTLVFHPWIAQHWDKILYMDGCMTFHSPHVSELFENIAVKNQILAQPEPKRWKQRTLEARLIPCANSTTVAQLEDRIGRRLASSEYFNSALLLFDTAIVREVPTTLVDILILYHELGGTVFQGDQQILSVYWMFLRKKYAVLPSTMFETDRVPYDFLGVEKASYIITARNDDREICRERPMQK